MYEKKSNVSYDIIDNSQTKYCGQPCTMDIFFAADDNFAQHLCVAITSILVNAHHYENFNFYILDGGISKKNKKLIEQLKLIKPCNIEYILIDDSIFDNIPMSLSCNHITRQTYYRYLVSRLKPNLERCLYFDCDIVVEQSLNELWHTNLEEYYVAGVEELASFARDYYIQTLGIQKSINAGILLINNKKWVEDEISKKLFENTSYLVQQDMFTWVDQDVINYTFQDKIFFIPPKYNLQQNAYFDTQHSQYTVQQMDAAKELPVIIHYNGPRKPWHAGCVHKLWRQYYKYLELSPYKFNMPKDIEKNYKEFDSHNPNAHRSRLYQVSARIYQKCLSRYPIFISMKNFIKNRYKMQDIKRKLKGIFS